MDANQERIDDYLDGIDRAYSYRATLADYDRMRVAYGRGLCSENELSRWLTWYDYAADTRLGWKGWLRYATIGRVER